MIQIERDRYYRQRCGNVHRVVCVDGKGPNYPVIDDMGHVYAPNGLSLLEKQSPDDLVAPVFEAGQKWREKETGQIFILEKYSAVDWDGWLGRLYRDGEMVDTEFVFTEKYLYKNCEQVEESATEPVNMCASCKELLQRLEVADTDRINAEQRLEKVTFILESTVSVLKALTPHSGESSCTDESEGENL